MATRSRSFDALTGWTGSNNGITLATLGSSASRQSTLITNPLSRPAAMIYLRIKTATAPTDGSTWELYLLRGDATSPTYVTDGAGSTDAVFAPTKLNATLLGTIVVGNSTNFFYGEFDTIDAGPLGPFWGIAVRNGTNQTGSTTESDFIKEFAYYTDVYT
jgi:hypothetical protein